MRAFFTLVNDKYIVNIDTQLQVWLDEACSNIDNAGSPDDIEAVRLIWMGKKGRLTDAMKALGQLDGEARKLRGAELNVVKTNIQTRLNSRKQQLESEALTVKLLQESLDVTLPGRSSAQGSLHPLTLTMQRIEDYFSKLGFSVLNNLNGPEIEDEFHNFEALNIPAHHPARSMHDTFYFGDGSLLRTHTSNMQIHAMKASEPPFRLLAMGKTYRSDHDITHSPMFHQAEGLVVDAHATFADLKGLLTDFMRSFFEQDTLDLRFRPSYFPFTEPSAEVDVRCVFCKGSGCRSCKQTGWLEVLGSGMVHPAVFGHVNVDPEVFTGYAFGIGIERLTMLRYGIDDMRVLFDNDIRFLKQFG